MRIDLLSFKLMNFTFDYDFADNWYGGHLKWRIWNFNIALSINCFFRSNINPLFMKCLVVKFESRIKSNKN